MDVADQDVKQGVEEIDTTLNGVGFTAVVNNAGIAVAGPVEYLPL